MKVTVEIKTTKTFEIDSDIYQFVKGLEGHEAFNKIVELVGEDVNQYETNDWDDADKLELIEENSSTVTWSHEVEKVSYEQRYRVYDYNNHKTLFRGNYDECSEFLAKGNYAGQEVDIIEH